MIRFLLTCRLASRFFLCPLLRLDNRLRKVITHLAISKEGGIHPKHRLTCYEQWFLDRIEPGWIVVDIGSNTGSMARLLATRSGHVYGIEICPTMVERACRETIATNVTYYAGDALTVDLQQMSPVDCVILSNVLEHIDDRIAMLKRLVREMPWRDGFVNILVRVPMINRDWLVLLKRELNIEHRLDVTHFTEYTEHDFISELAAANLCAKKIEIRFGELFAVCSTAGVFREQ